MQFQGLAQLGLGQLLAGNPLGSQQPQQPTILPSQNLLTNILQLSNIAPPSQQAQCHQILQNSEPAGQNFLSNMLQFASGLPQPPITKSQLGLQSNGHLPPNLLPAAQNQLPLQPQLSQQDLKHNSSEHLPLSLFPVSRENVKAKQTVKLRRHNSLNSVDRYKGYGTPNPPSESVLANAVMNKEQAKKSAESSKTVFFLFRIF